MLRLQYSCMSRLSNTLTSHDVSVGVGTGLIHSDYYIRIIIEDLKLPENQSYISMLFNL
jgi:hypothetical protein